MPCFSIVLQLRRLGSQLLKKGAEDQLLKISPKFAATLWHESDSEVRKMASSDDFLKLKSTKFAPRCGARAMRKSKP